MNGPKFMSQHPSSLTREAFVSRYGGIYEHSPWIAAAAYDAGLPAAADGPEGLAAALRLQVEAAAEAQQLALLQAHPDLAGKLALRGVLTADSTSEQADAGLDSCSPEELARFQSLNTRYREKFAFPFILAVKGFDRQEILAIFERRVGNDRPVEFREALDQVHRIARVRLNALAEEEASHGS